MKILVTGAGGPAGVCIIKDLRKRHKVIAVDSDFLASGLYLVEKRFIVPSYENHEAFSKILEIAKNENVDVVIPTVDEEMLHFANSITEFKKNGITVVVSNPKSIEITTNKSTTYNFFQGNSYCPKVYDFNNVEFPCVVKPNSARGSRGFYVCHSTEDLNFAIKKNKKDLGDSVIMEYLEGTEFSVYGISDLNGNTLVSVANKRIMAVGESKKAQIIDDKEIQDTANTIARKLKLSGPWNVQIMKTKNGPKLIEINPRFSGSISLPIASGLDLVEISMKVFRNEEIKPSDLEYEKNIIMTRYNEEIFVRPDKSNLIHVM
ncbi:MAG TPA: ATP-grasp domain-containing protein [Nitrosopumilaceae archaeon]|nr:ATP-grasp domain-containing protein [Nitrosopumilaceae archaeon]